MALALLAAIFLFGCTPDKLGGLVKENQPPTLSFTNLPFADSVFTSNALIYWYGVDSDGQVVNYYYIVVLDSLVGGDPEAYIANVLDTLSIDQWVETSSTDANIQMYAADNEVDMLHQYLFVKCVDDAGAYSNTLYYSLFRLNRLPQTYLDLLPGNYSPENNDTVFTNPVWSLPDTNALWKGLTFTWNGEDTLDFPDGAPDFQYSWVLYGPFDISHYDTAAHIIDLTLDDMTEDSIRAYSCADYSSGIDFPLPGEGFSGCTDRWVWDKTITAKNLATGCYLFTVVVRDDAQVPDTSAAWGTFATVMPAWDESPYEAKDIMLLRATRYYTNNRAGYPQETTNPADPNVYYPDSLLDFYVDMIMGAGYSIDPDSDVFGTLGILQEADLPTMFDLAKYRMIIFDDMNWDRRHLGPDGTGPFIEPLKNYLRAGGKIWVLGRQTLDPTGAGESGPSNFDNASIAFNFFDLSSAIYAMPDLSDSAEFRGAASVMSGYSDLQISPERTMQMGGQYGLNKVEVLVRYSVNSTTLFTYRAANPDTMQAFEYMPCAVRYYPENHVYKTSYFSFPLYMMDNSDGQVQTVFTDMLHWFLN